MTVKSRILVVDDERAANFLIRQIFRNEMRDGAYALEFAMNGVEALDILEGDSNFHLVMTDINMPRLDGLTMLSVISERYPHIKVVMVSAYSDMSKIRKAMNYGAYDYVTKPIDPKDLKDTVRRALALVHRNE
ncbi:MAG: response regulator [Acidobacteriota bacterium]|nr:response regulator [Acidobacteriota bacterium]